LLSLLSPGGVFVPAKTGGRIATLGNELFQEKKRRRVEERTRKHSLSSVIRRGGLIKILSLKKFQPLNNKGFKNKNGEK